MLTSSSIPVKLVTFLFCFSNIQCRLNIHSFHCVESIRIYFKSRNRKTEVNRIRCHIILMLRVNYRQMTDEIIHMEVDRSQFILFLQFSTPLWCENDGFLFYVRNGLQ